MLTGRDPWQQNTWPTRMGKMRTISERQEG
jgi:hypothetical protein